jgi:5'-methylthioadenosine phosphorylase
MSRVGVIGGSGLYKIEGLKRRKELSLNTPFGRPSGKFIFGELEGREIVFLPRHDIGHHIPPGRINYRANIFGMKKLGVERIISVSACGSLKEQLRPMDFVVVEQFVDRTNSARKMTFFDEGIVAHIEFSRPVCDELSNALYNAAHAVGVRVHPKATYINMEGPAFSTLAESNLYRSLGMDIIGMTNMAEARLAREAEICYSTLAAVTDYDCWHPTHSSVTIEMVISNLQNNIENAKKILVEAIRSLKKERDCRCHEALKHAIVTDRRYIAPRTKKKLALLIKKYI